MKLLVWLGIVSCLTVCAQVPNTSREKMPWQGDESGRTAVAVQFLNPAQVNVVPGRPSIVEMHFHIADGLHINSHAPHDANLVPTQMAVVDIPGLKTQNVDFPDGTDTSLPFAPKQKLSVYTGELVVKAQVVASTGSHQWQGIMRYQACNLNQCMPPRKLPVSVEIIAK